MSFDYRHAATAFWVFIGSVLLALAGCSTTGANFDASSLDLFRPGQTTLSQASALLKSDPVVAYHQGDGSVMARWAHRASFVPDAIYFNRELWLAFDRNGHFERIVKSINVPQAGQVDQTNRAAHVTQTRPFHTAPVLSSDSPAASSVQL